LFTFDECRSETELASLISLLGQSLREHNLPVIHFREAFQEEIYSRWCARYQWNFRGRVLFPIFLALRYQSHFTCVLGCFPPQIEIIHAIRGSLALLRNLLALPLGQALAAREALR
jgi:hypothetical protein